MICLSNFEKTLEFHNEFQYMSYDMAFLEWHILKLQDSCYVYVKVMIIPSFIFLLQTYFAEGGQEKANQTKFLACRQYNSKVIFLTLLTLKFTYHMSPPIFYNDISADFKRWFKEIVKKWKNKKTQMYIVSYNI